MSNVVNINADRWVTVFSAEGVTVRASSTGRLVFEVAENAYRKAYSKPLSLEQAVCLFESLAEAYGCDLTQDPPQPLNNEDDDGRPDPAC